MLLLSWQSGHSVVLNFSGTNYKFGQRLMKGGTAYDLHINVNLFDFQNMQNI